LINTNVSVRVMVFNATYTNISVISWQAVLLVEETGVHGKNHWIAVSHWQTLSYNVVSSTPRDELQRYVLSLKTNAGSN
jgi:hypothetical protein